MLFAELCSLHAKSNPQNLSLLWASGSDCFVLLLLQIE
jgi:hypothetical protein